MRVMITFKPENDRERAALKLLNFQPDRVDGSFESWGELEREHRILGALIDILKLAIIP